MSEGEIKLGLCYQEKDSSFGTYQVGRKKYCADYVGSITIPQKADDLGNSIAEYFIKNKKFANEFLYSKKVEIIPLIGLGTRSVTHKEIRNLVSLLADMTTAEVLLHIKPKRVEDIE